MIVLLREAEFIALVLGLVALAGLPVAVAAWCRRRAGLRRAARPFREVYAEAQAAHDGGTCGGTAGGCRFEPEHER